MVISEKLALLLGYFGVFEELTAAVTIKQEAIVQLLAVTMYLPLLTTPQ
jgi:hypothetical protein